MKNKIKKSGILGVVLLAGLLIVACDSSTGTGKSGTPTSSAPPAATQGKARNIDTEVVMYKSPSCDCCSGWAEHLRNAGFNVTVKQSDDMDGIKAENGVPQNLSSCHTAKVGGYVIEGHVPASDVERLLKERPDIAGLTAPGMPMKSPGMQEAGLPPKNYNVLAFDKSGKTYVFSRY